MNEVEEKLYCKEEILIKYSGLFQTSHFDIFCSQIECLDEEISKKYSSYISIFLYVKDEDNNILHTREIVYNPSMPKKKQFFFNKFENFRKYYYQFTSKSDMKKLSISYCIVPHKSDSDITNYDKILGINEKFIKINSTQEKKIFHVFNEINVFNVMFEHIKNNYIKYVTFVSPIVSFLVMVVVLNKIDSLPMQTINLNILKFIAPKYLIILLLIFGLILGYGYFLFIPTKSFLLKICRKKYIMRFIQYQDLLSLVLSVLFLSIGITIYIEFINSLSPISSIAKDYIFKTQTPTILKIQNKNTNTSENILYLGSDDMIYYFTDKDINHFISENEKLYKEVCTGRDTGYLDHLMPLLEKRTFYNKVYKSLLKRDIHVLPQNLSFQDTFCFTDYPKIVKKISEERNETVLWMGVKYKQDKFSEAKDTNTSYYYNESQIHDMLKKNPQFEKYASNKDLWIKYIMREKALENVDYKLLENANFVDINETNSSKEFYR